MATDILTVIEQDGALVVDSRLIAERLGVTHEAILKTIDKHLSRLQQKAPVRFEIDVVKRPQLPKYICEPCAGNELGEYLG